VAFPNKENSPPAKKYEERGKPEEKGSGQQSIQTVEQTERPGKKECTPEENRSGRHSQERRKEKGKGDIGQRKGKKGVIFTVKGPKEKGESKKGAGTKKRIGR